MIAVIGLTIFAARWLILGPLDTQRRTIQMISEGKLDILVPALNRGDEIGAIAHSVENLRRKLQDAAALQWESSFKGTAFSSASSAMMMTDRELNV